MFQVSNAIVAGVRRVFPDAEVLITAMADGGDGTLEVLMRGTGGHTHEDTVTGPLGEPVKAFWGVLGSTNTAVVEMANASGLALVPRDRRDPLITTTYGTGELIRHALDNGYRKFILGVGGSATCDGGAGVAQALGVRFLDESGAELPFGGGPMARLARIDVSGIDPRATESTFQVATDVTNPLCGPEGTAAIYGPQKGATPEIIAQLDAALGNFADVVRRDFGIDQRDDQGAGAAGGLAYGMKVFFPTELRAGVEVVADAVKFVEQLDGADLVITGEGQIDGQSSYGKTIMGVASRAKGLNIPVIALAGNLAPEYRSIYEQGVTSVMSIAPGPIALDAAIHDAGAPPHRGHREVTPHGVHRHGPLSHAQTTKITKMGASLENVTGPEDELRGCKVPVLDKGYVHLLDYIGGDERILDAARVSTGAKSDP